MCVGVGGVVLCRCVCVTCLLCVCVGVGGVVLCRCVCVCDLLIFSPEPSPEQEAETIDFF